jgi:hypothetical protein
LLSIIGKAIGKAWKRGLEKGSDLFIEQIKHKWYVIKETRDTPHIFIANVNIRR